MQSFRIPMMDNVLSIKNPTRDWTDRKEKLNILIINRYREKSPVLLDSNSQLEATTTSASMSSSADASDIIYESVLRLKHVQPDQSGEFECRPQGLPPAHVNLHIVKGNDRVGN